ncbi:MAG: hypothetical protein AAGN35_25725 [Bacteroidota bacterium]
MRRPIYLILTAVVLLGPARALNAQNLLFFEQADSKSFLIGYNDGGPSQAITNFFLENLSQSSGKSVTQTEYVLIHDSYLRATKLNSAQYQVYGTVNSIRFSGDTRYRGFEMAGQLRPSAVRFKLERRSPEGMILDQWDFGSVPVAGDPTVIVNFKATDSLTGFEDHNFRYRDLAFLYTKDDKLPFIERKQAIDNYYAAVPQLEALYGELKRIDPENIEQLGTQQTTLGRLRSQIETLRAGNYAAQLGLTEQFDPAGFQPRFREVDQYAADLASRIEYNRANVYLLYYERGRTHLENGQRPKALADLNEAIRLKGDFAPAHLTRARLRYQEGNLQAAGEGLVYVFSDLSPDEATRTEATTLGATIYQNRIGNARYAVQQGRFEESLAETDAAALLCQSVSGLNCADLEGVQRLAHDGIITRYLDNADKAIASGRADLAIQDAEKAKAYAAEHGASLAQHDRIRTVLDAAYRMQYERMLADVEELLRNQDLDGAEQQMEASLKFSAAHPGAVTDTTRTRALQTEIKGRRYRQFISSGAGLRGGGYMAKALERFEAALAIEKEFAVAKDTSLPRIALATARDLAREYLQDALEKARSNRLTAARERRLEVEDLRKRFDVLGDPRLKATYNELKAAIFSQECANAQADLDRFVAQANNQSAVKRYLDAQESYQQALVIASENAPCGLKVEALNAGRRHIAPAVAYQKARADIETQLDRALFRQAAEAYLATGVEFQRDTLGVRFGLSHPALFDYIQAGGRPGFILHGVGHFADAQNYPSALSLLDLAFKSYSNKELKPIMTRLGQELAKRDHQSDPSIDPKTYPVIYINGEKRMKTLLKAYKKQWKTL